MLRRPWLEMLACVLVSRLMVTIVETGVGFAGRILKLHGGGWRKMGSGEYGSKKEW